MSDDTGHDDTQGGPPRDRSDLHQNTSQGLEEDLREHERTQARALVPEPGDDASGRHPVNVGHLVMGVAFLGLTVIWALFESGTIGSEDLRWLMPLPWLAAGVAGLLAVLLTGRRRGGSTY
jgi:hypothetical protein